jgi:hypothetical protein
MTDKIIARLKGVIMLRAEVYKAIAEDLAATQEAWIVFVVATVLSGLSSFFAYSPLSGGSTFTFFGGIVGILIALVIGAVGLYFTAFVLAWVAKQFGGKTTTNEMLRVSGYVKVFSAIGFLNLFVAIIPVLGCLTAPISLVVALLGLAGYVIGVREAAEFSTGNAIITAIIAAVVNFVIVVAIGGAIVGAVVVALSGVAR